MGDFDPVDAVEDLAQRGGQAALDAASKSGNSALRTAADIAKGAAAGAAKGTLIGTAVGEAVTWGSIGAAAALSAAGSGAAALGTLSAGMAIGSAIPIPGLGTIIGAIIGALTAIANAVKGPDWKTIAATPEQAQELLAVFRAVPTFMPHFWAIVTRGTDPAQIAGQMSSLLGRPDPAMRDAAASDPQFTAEALAMRSRPLLLLAGEARNPWPPGAPPIAWSGPYIYPNAMIDFGGDLRAQAIRGPDRSAWSDARVVAFMSRPASAQDDPLMQPGVVAKIRQAWLDSATSPPIVQSAAEARRVLNVLRRHAPSIRVPTQRSGAIDFDLRPLGEEIKRLREFAGESGRDPILERVFGDVTVSLTATDWFWLAGITVAAVGVGAALVFRQGRPRLLLNQVATRPALREPGAQAFYDALTVGVRDDQVQCGGRRRVDPRERGDLARAYEASRVLNLSPTELAVSGRYFGGEPEPIRLDVHADGSIHLRDRDRGKYEAAKEQGALAILADVVEHDMAGDVVAERRAPVRLL